jgi:hypothetical protein
MNLDFVESRVANPVKLVDWGRMDESQTAICPCCGWRGRWGECAAAAAEEARVYACAECAMPLLVRVMPKVIPLRFINSAAAWREDDRRAANDSF